MKKTVNGLTEKAFGFIGTNGYKVEEENGKYSVYFEMGRLKKHLQRFYLISDVTLDEMNKFLEEQADDEREYLDSVWEEEIDNM